MATASCTVLIAASDLIAELTASASAHGEVLAFTDSEALRALEAITARRPHVITLDHEFAATARGAALISRVQADPALKHSEIRVVSEHGETVASNVPGQAPAALDQSGTRRAPRYRIPGAVEVMVDGSASVLIDLSSVGAQVVHPRVLRPNQRVRVVLPDPDGTIRIAGVVAWASFEIPPGKSPCYRVGIEFRNPDQRAVDGFRSKHTD